MTCRATVPFYDMPHLGDWVKSRVGFVSIDPWQGYAALGGSDGEFPDKPGIGTIPQDQSCDFSITIAPDSLGMAKKPQSSKKKLRPQRDRSFFEGMKCQLSGRRYPRRG